MIELKHLYKCYEQPVLNDINLTLYPGHIYVLNGPSGSGKSSLFHILGGLDSAYEGDVFYQNTALKAMNKATMKSYQDSIGYVFQESLLIPQFSVLENLRMFCNDEEKIYELAKHFGLFDILSQYPTNLSNGERQRIAIMRTLLLNPSILLMDEPTASLDQQNAHILLQQIVQLKNDKRILIISTHDPIFQEIADVMLYMEYGTLTQEQKAPIESLPNIQDTTDIQPKDSKHWSFDLLYSFRKHHSTMKNIGFLLSAALLFLILFLSFTFKMNFKESYEQKLAEEYPTQVIFINKQFFDRFHDQSLKMESFSNYQKEYDGFTALSYFPKEDSSLAIPQAIEFGSFPSLKSEVVVNMEYIKSMFPDATPETMVQKELIIEGNTYNIAGILTADEAILKDVYSSNTYYRDIKGPLVFMSEQAMQTFTSPKDDLVVMAKLTNVKMNDTIYTELFDTGASSYFYRVLHEKLYSVNFIFYLIQICLFVIALMMFLFMYFVIQLDLFHRKRELGYLQILHIHKKRVATIVRFDYLLKVAPPLLLSLVGYFVSIAIINHYLQFTLPYDIMLIILLSLGIYVYVLIVIEKPLRNYMKKDILWLIKN